MPPKAKSVEQEMFANAPVVDGAQEGAQGAQEPDTSAAEWLAYLASLDEFTREQVNLADKLEADYKNCLEQRESNREILRHLAKQGKIDRKVVDSFYPPKVMTKPRKRKGETDAEYEARAAEFSTTNGDAS